MCVQLDVIRRACAFYNPKYNDYVPAPRVHTGADFDKHVRAVQLQADDDGHLFPLSQSIWSCQFCEIELFPARKLSNLYRRPSMATCE